MRCEIAGAGQAHYQKGLCKIPKNSWSENSMRVLPRHVHTLPHAQHEARSRAACRGDPAVRPKVDARIPDFVPRQPFPGLGRKVANSKDRKAPIPHHTRDGRAPSHG